MTKKLYLTMKSAEVERLNNSLYLLLPVLRERLEIKFGAALDEWLDKCETKSVRFELDQHEPCSFDSAVESVESDAADGYALDMDGWEGMAFIEMFSPADKKELSELLRGFVESRSPSFALKNCIQAMDVPYFPDKNRDTIIFFVYGAIVESDAPRELADLWILRSWKPTVFDDSFPYGYIYTLDDGAGFNECWEVCRDVLPPEIIPVFDVEWISEEK